ncbi:MULTISPECIES: acetyltransferase [unclassified Candidatus Frackibacter]|uniref:acetyltransferase n=1 Tax=unclassified Candidatus Frackibacter TaxID=2648818 RepID=UPI000890851A|nr:MULTISPECIES: acetyltransferase [unclassified Candidatus Frackibacter]SDC72844.1 CoA binding domain-containing protein [Candidatus Frackibacter sp. WG11]SEM87111.1 CoA binding domain-containing protein [Candidatus Frackibacter sp. WG12]SFL96169.1 CoA binding domain-containing protein [Candidatus Frackibacter sp. WG13]
MSRKVVLIGAGGHAKVVIDLLKSNNNIKIIGMIDKNKNRLGEKILDIPIIASDKELIQTKKKVNNTLIAVGGTGDNRLRVKLYNKVKELGYNFINAIHPNSIIGEEVDLGNANTIMAGVILNSGVKLGTNNIINTGAILEHDVEIGNHVHIAPGVKLSGGVKISDYSHLGTGVTVIQGINIGGNSLIGAGSVIIDDVPDNSLVVGNPGRIIKKRRGIND